ncbi:hypothetical protein ACS8FD_06250 [Psychrobacter sp. 1U2]|uniref:hypothetical protein n=1 Tax=Psychrobacter sp. 1U2 TaxID=3453577 RepID=UPI003F47032F
MHDSNDNSGNEAQDSSINNSVNNIENNSIDRSLAHSLLSEEELQYFSGQKKNNKLLSTIFTNKGSGLKIVAASMVLVLLGAAAVLFSLNTTDSSSTEDLVATANEDPIAPEEIITDNRTAAVTENTSASPDNIEIDSAKTDSKKSDDPLGDKQISQSNQEVAEEQSLQADKQTTVSYEDFAKEAQSTLYRDSDY